MAIDLAQIDLANPAAGRAHVIEPRASGRNCHVMCGTAAGGFMFAFVRPIVKLFTSWSDTTATQIAGARSWVASIRRTDCFPDNADDPSHDPCPGAGLGRGSQQAAYSRGPWGSALRSASAAWAQASFCDEAMPRATTSLPLMTSQYQPGPFSMIRYSMDWGIVALPVQAGARPVSQPPTPDQMLQSVMNTVCAQAERIAIPLTT
jgi:hypothetical protein